jgi:hypothetical protein
VANIWFGNTVVLWYGPEREIDLRFVKPISLCRCLKAPMCREIHEMKDVGYI